MRDLELRTEPGREARDELCDRHHEWRAANPGRHARDAAQALGVTEAELVDAERRCQPESDPRSEGAGVCRLDPTRLRDLLRAFGRFGPVKTMTRNECAVLEKWGAFERIEADEGPLGQVVGADVDLRLFFHQLGSVYAVVEERSAPEGKRGSALRRSFQLFDRHGDSAFKLFVERDEDVELFEQLAGSLADPRVQDPLLLAPAPELPAPKALLPEEVEALREDWDAMTNTHQFFGLLRRYGLQRTEALDLAGESRARRVGLGAPEQLLLAAATSELPIMIFVGSRGVLQIHSGPVRRVMRGGGWLNVLDAEVNLHLRDDQVARAYVVAKPTSEGVVHSLELFDVTGETIAIFFSKRKPGQQELPGWKRMLDALAGETT